MRRHWTYPLKFKRLVHWSFYVNQHLTSHAMFSCGIWSIKLNFSFIYLRWQHPLNGKYTFNWELINCRTRRCCRTQTSIFIPIELENRDIPSHSKQMNWFTIVSLTQSITHRLTFATIGFETIVDFRFSIFNFHSTRIEMNKQDIYSINFTLHLLWVVRFSSQQKTYLAEQSHSKCDT